MKMRTWIGGSAAVLIFCVAVSLSMAAHADERMAPGIGCSILVAQAGDTMLLGSDVGDGNPNTYYRVFPAREDDDYGYVTLGFSQAQGGLNEAGLAFDTNAVPEEEPTAKPDRGGCGSATCFHRRSFKVLLRRTSGCWFWLSSTAP